MKGLRASDRRRIDFETGAKTVRIVGEGNGVGQRTKRRQSDQDLRPFGAEPRAVQFSPFEWRIGLAVGEAREVRAGYRFSARGSSVSLNRLKRRAAPAGSGIN